MIQAGQKFTWSYVPADGNAGLFIQATITDQSPARGDVVATVPMSYDGLGAYRGTWPGFVAGHNYSIESLAYTDDTYTTPNSEYPAPQVIDAQCLRTAPIIVQGLRVQVGCEDQPRQRPVVVAQNSDLNILLTFTDECGNPIDVTAATSIELSALEADGTTVLTKELGTDIALVSGQPSQALVTMLAADFALLPTGDNDVQVTLVLSGENNVLNVYSAMSVEPAAV